MAFTDDSDLFGAIHEEGLNLVVQHIMKQRPSWFNYGTAQVAANLELLCEPIDVAPAVIDRGNPMITVEDPLPVLGTDGLIGVNFCFQLTAAEIDLHPESIVTLPPELSPPLAEQHFAIHGQVCGGIGCPPKEFIDNFQLPTPDPVGTAPPQQPEIVLPTRELECFCLELFVIGHVEITGPLGNQRLQGKVDGLEIVDIQPEGLENNVECYLNLLIQLVILPRTSVAISKLLGDIFDFPMITLKPSTSVPNNPAIEDDQFKAFIDLEVSP